MKDDFSIKNPLLSSSFDESYDRDEENPAPIGAGILGVQSEAALRPITLTDFVGQKDLKDNLRVFIQSAKKRKAALDHLLFFGPPGLGKTTLAQISASELGVGFRATSGPTLSKTGDIVALLTNLQPNDILFIDEIHRLPMACEETLYPAMEDFQVDILVGEGPAARSIKIDLPPFTLVGATTRVGSLSSPLRDRFGITLRLDYYHTQDLSALILKKAELLSLNLSLEGAQELACRSRGTPRIAGRLLRRVRDYAEVLGSESVDASFVNQVLRQLKVESFGLDEMDRRYLRVIETVYDGGPVGVEPLAAALSEERSMLEDVVEPFLMQIGFLQRTARGRCLTLTARNFLRENQNV